MTWEVREGDCIERMAEMPDASVQCCVTSPPYWGLRDYGDEGQLGLEETPEQFVAKMVEVFAEVRRVLRDDGTLWLNLGDSYNAYNGNAGPASGIDAPDGARSAQRPDLASGHGLRDKSLKPKDLIGIPWMVAFALRADGWYLRRDIIWAKPNPMPESVTDRPTSSHEYLFLLTKGARYFYDAEAIREESTGRTDTWPQSRGRADEGGWAKPRSDKQRGHGRRHDGFNDRWDAMSKDEQQALGRNKRSVWQIATRLFSAPHFATYPPALVEPCVLAGSAHGDTVLDCFSGAATTGLVAAQLGRHYIGIELNPEYVEMGRQRIERWEADPAGVLDGPPVVAPGQMGLEL